MFVHRFACTTALAIIRTRVAGPPPRGAVESLEAAHYASPGMSISRTIDVLRACLSSWLCQCLECVTVDGVLCGDLEIESALWLVSGGLVLVEDQSGTALGHFVPLF